MEHIKGTLIGQRELRLVWASWLPDGEPKAVAVVVHGYSEHMGRYAHVIKALVERDYAVYAIDHRGHGGSGGVRAYVERFDNFVDDLHLLVLMAKDAHPDLQVFMIAHSMGGLIGVRYALRHQRELAGLVLSGAALQFADRFSPTLRRLSRVLSILVPTMPITQSSQGTESGLSRDPAVQLAWDNDPLCYNGKLRARMGYEFMMASLNAYARTSELSLPLLVMHGAEDRVTNPLGSQHLYDTARSTDKTLKLWPGCRHEIFNEWEKDEIIAYAIDWIDAHVHQTEQQLADLHPA